MSAKALAVRRTFAERIEDFLDVVECRPLASAEDREQVFRLRYDAYVREGAIPICFSKRFTDPYDDVPNVWIFGLYVDGQLASSIRVHVASPHHPDCPALSVFPDLLLPQMEQGHTIVDPTRFVAERSLARSYPELPYATVRLGFLASEFFNADLGLATVRAEHQAFYRRVFGLQPLCEPRDYPSLAKPISLMAINYAEVRDRIIACYPFMRSKPGELWKLFGRQPNAVEPAKYGPWIDSGPVTHNAPAEQLQFFDAR